MDICPNDNLANLSVTSKWFNAGNFLEQLMILGVLLLFHAL